MEKLKLNLNYFFKPKNKFLNNLALKNYNFYKIDIYDEKPCIYISPMVSEIDYNLITKCLNIKFVFLKDEIVEKINADELTNQEKQIILDEIKRLNELGFSISFLWNTNPSVFGENEKITKQLALFLHKTQLDVKILTFPGEFFAQPIWSKEKRNNKIYANQKITIKAKTLKGLSKQEIVKIFQNSTPSSATEYSNKFPVDIKSNNKASGLEQVLYACPNCKKLLSIRSEFSCIKCKECGSAIEFTSTGEILFSKNLNTFDDLENYQFTCLKRHDFNINKIIEYDKITQILSENLKKPIKVNVILQIYADKLVLENPVTHKKTTYHFEDMESVKYLYNNKILIKLKNAKQICFFGNNNENLYIIKDLVKINKN